MTQPGQEKQPCLANDLSLKGIAPRIVCCGMVGVRLVCHVLQSMQPLCGLHNHVLQSMQAEDHDRWTHHPTMVQRTTFRFK